MKALRMVFVLVILIALPIAGRLAYFYTGVYTPPRIMRPDLAAINVPTPELVQFVDAPQKADSVVLFDLAHSNNLREAELNVLWGHLTARGSQPEFVKASEPLATKLRRAQGYVIISPRVPFTPEEARQVKHFVDTGGHLLLMTDPTRFDIGFDALGFPKDRTPDVAIMNALSASFGLVFEDDYVYNMTANEGSFRNVILTQFGDSIVTKGLKKVTLFAAHSISTNGRPIVTTDANTRSSLSEKQGGLAVAALTQNDRVLGLGDVTCLTPPYSSVSDNDRLLSNVADFLTGGQRTYDLVDFPYFFGEHVNLMYAGKKAIGGDVLSQAGLLQRAFDVAGKRLTPRKADSLETDSLFIGLFDGTEYVQRYLSTRQISVTLSVDATPVAATEALSSTVAPTATPDATASVTVTATPTVTVTATATPQPPAEAPIKGLVSVADLGEFPTESVTLLSLANENGHPVMIVLGATQEGLAQALALLAREDLSQCLTSNSAALCPAMPSFPPIPTDVYVPPPPGEVPITTTSEFVQPVEPPSTVEPPAKAP